MRQSRPKTGLFSPQNPQKYVGNCKNIVFRSSWELKLFKYLDRESKVKKWGSEEFSIPYFDPVTQQNRRYFPDVFVIVEDKSGNERKIVIEVKPHKETIEPIPTTTPTGKPTQSYLYEATTYATNTAKWEAARLFCKNNGIDFLIMTEYELGIKKKST